MQLDVRADFKEVRRALNRAERRLVPRAASRALNRARQASATATRRHLQAELGIRRGARKLGRRILRRYGRRATPEHLTAIFSFGTFNLPIGDYIKPTPGTNRIGRFTFPGAFYARMPKSGHRNVFERFGAKRDIDSPTRGRYRGQPIRKVTIDVTAAVRAAGTRALAKEGADTWRRRLEYELLRELRRYWRG